MEALAHITDVSSSVIAMERSRLGGQCEWIISDRLIPLGLVVLRGVITKVVIHLVMFFLTEWILAM